MKAKEAETSPTSLSDQIKKLVKVQLTRSSQFGFRAFQSFRRPHYFFYTIYLFISGINEWAQGVSSKFPSRVFFSDSNLKRIEMRGDDPSRDKTSKVVFGYNWMYPLLLGALWCQIHQ